MMNNLRLEKIKYQMETVKHFEKMISDLYQMADSLSISNNNEIVVGLYIEKTINTIDKVLAYERKQLKTLTDNLKGGENV